MSAFMWKTDLELSPRISEGGIQKLTLVTSVHHLDASCVKRLKVIVLALWKCHPWQGFLSSQANSVLFGFIADLK